jgi:hypothetical protein
MVAQLRPDGRPTGLTVRKLPVNISWTPPGLPEALCAARARLKARFECPLCTDDQPGLSRWRNNSPRRRKPLAASIALWNGLGLAGFHRHRRLRNRGGGAGFARQESVKNDGRPVKNS